MFHIQRKTVLLLEVSKYILFYFILSPEKTTTEKQSIAEKRDLWSVCVTVTHKYQ